MPRVHKLNLLEFDQFVGQQGQGPALGSYSGRMLQASAARWASWALLSLR